MMTRVVHSQARFCFFSIAQLRLLTRDAIRRPRGEGIILLAPDLSTFCMWLAEILAVLVLYDLFSIVI
jgi:hypothetical protein